MKKITSLALLLMLSITSIAQVNGYNVGDVVDDFTVTDIHGVEHNLYEYAEAGKYIYLDFFFDTCGPCQQTTPMFNEFFDKYGCNQGDLIMISMNNGSDSDAEVEAFENAFGGPFNHAPAISAEGGAGDVDADFNIAAYPTYCMISPDKTLLVSDIWPLTGVETFEATFPNGLDPEVMECTILGVTEVANASFSIFPTVSNGQNITIVMNNQKTTNVRIYDITGREVYANDTNSNTIEFSMNVSSGTYFVKVKTESSSATKKIIIK
tara:strand:+ start:52 stop:849 length:798 start_codon:yes stop_codon:yes gene_type:complete